MKKNLLLGLITILSVIIVSGCTNKNIDPKVVGKWKYTDDDFSVEYVFKENGTGTIKFSKGKTLFLILQSTSSDYRISFLATEKKWSTILTGVKGVSIPKNAKGDKWLKFVNKGIAEASVIKSFIRESVKGADEEIARIEAEKEAEKQRKLEAKNAPKASENENQ